MYVQTTMEEMRWYNVKLGGRCKGRDPGKDVNALSYGQHAKQPVIWKERDKEREGEREEKYSVREEAERKRDRERNDTCTWPEGSRGRRYKAVAGRSYKREAAEQWGYGGAGQAGSGEMREGRGRGCGGMVGGERSKGEKNKTVFFLNLNLCAFSFFFFPKIQRTHKE